MKKPKLFNQKPDPAVTDKDLEVVAGEVKRKLQEELRNKVMTITFMKINGEKRVMRCTLMPEYLPVQDKQTGDDQKHKAPNVYITTVWDVDKKDWRSFRTSSIVEIETTYDLPEREIAV
jgi:hypothetical protein